jgi:hypothetical protein
MMIIVCVVVEKIFCRRKKRKGRFVVRLFARKNGERFSLVAPLFASYCTLLLCVLAFCGGSTVACALQRYLLLHVAEQLQATTCLVAKTGGMRNIVALFYCVGLLWDKVNIY